MWHDPMTTRSTASGIMAGVPYRYGTVRYSIIVGDFRTCTYAGKTKNRLIRPIKVPGSSLRLQQQKLCFLRHSSIEKRQSNTLNSLSIDSCLFLFHTRLISSKMAVSRKIGVKEHRAEQWRKRAYYCVWISKILCRSSKRRCLRLSSYLIRVVVLSA